MIAGREGFFALNIARQGSILTEVSHVLNFARNCSSPVSVLRTVEQIAEALAPIFRLTPIIAAAAEIRATRDSSALTEPAPVASRGKRTVPGLVPIFLAIPIIAADAVSLVVLLRVNKGHAIALTKEVIACLFRMTARAQSIATARFHIAVAAERPDVPTDVHCPVIAKVPWGRLSS
jgi:hypothetical protein